MRRNNPFFRFSILAGEKGAGRRDSIYRVWGWDFPKITLKDGELS